MSIECSLDFLPIYLVKHPFYTCYGSCILNSIFYSVSTFDVSAIAVLDDYQAKSELVTLQPNDIQIPFLVNILDDDIVENTEQFGVRVTSTDPQVNVQNGDLLVSIGDNDSK